MGAALLLLVALSWRADMQTTQASTWLTLLDVAVGVGFVAAGYWAAGPTSERALIGLVGVAWLIGSVLPVLGLVHQAVLAAALLAFPSGRLRGWPEWAAVGLAALVAFQLVPQLGTALLFGWIAILASRRSRSDPVAARYPVVAASAIGATLVVSWLIGHVWSETIPTGFAVIGYDAVLSAIAAAFPPSAWAVIRARERFVDQVLPGDSSSGLEGLTRVLRVALGDAELTIVANGEDIPSTVSPWGESPGGRQDQGLLVRADDGHPIATVLSRAAVLDDPRTAAAVSAAIRLEVTQIRLRRDQAVRMQELQASTMRILAAADRQRQLAAAEIRQDIEPTLISARAEVGAIRSGIGNPEVAGMLSVVEGELQAASHEIAELVAGVPPARFGTAPGMLTEALSTLTAGGPLPVRLDVPADLRAGADIETAIYYCCAEAVTNALKHSGATAIDISVCQVNDTIEATVSDDGCGGADLSGSGLRGLVDRISAQGGRLRVISPPGAGTVVRVSIRQKFFPA